MTGRDRSCMSMVFWGEKNWGRVVHPHRGRFHCPCSWAGWLSGIPGWWGKVMAPVHRGQVWQRSRWPGPLLYYIMDQVPLWSSVGHAYWEVPPFTTQLVNRIWRGEFVDMAALLQDNLEAERSRGRDGKEP